MTGRENDDKSYEDQDAEPSLNAPGDEGPTGIGDEGKDDDED